MKRNILIITLMMMCLTTMKTFAMSPVFIDADYIAADMNGEEVPVHLLVDINGINLTILNGVDSMNTVPNENNAVDALTNAWTPEGRNVALVNISYLAFNDVVYTRNTTSITGNDLMMNVEDPSMFIDPNYFEIRIVDKDGNILLNVNHLGYIQ